MSRSNQRGGWIDVDARIRQNIGSAGLAAALLIFFGFFWVDAPTGADWWSAAGRVFLLTLKIGGLAMAGVAIWCSFGEPLALLCDSIVSCAIGVILAGTGLVMLLDGGGYFQPAVNIVCGVLFLSAGLRNGRDYLSFPAVYDDDDEETADELVASTSTAAAPRDDKPSPFGADGDPDLVEFAPKPKRKSSVTTRGARFGVTDEAIKLPLDDEPAPPHSRPNPQPRPSPPPDGFLADLAEDDPADGK